jgi:redox-sensing transcriptional repressor
MDQPVSEATVGRLPTYLRSLGELAAADEVSVSSARLARLADVNPATLRRDLSSLGITGTRGVGYDVKDLLFEVSLVLGGNQEWPVVLIGAGNLGRAIANYGGMGARGFPVVAVVDNDPSLVGTRIGGLTVDDVDRLADLVLAHEIKVGIIATSAAAAQGVSDDLVAAGVTSILNFTAEPLKVPRPVVVRRVDLATELQILSFYKRRDIAVAGGAGVPLGVEPDEPAGS